LKFIPSHIQETQVSLLLKHTKNRSRRLKKNDDRINQRQSNKYGGEHARLNDKLNGDELRTDDENKKMEHSAAGLWKTLKIKKRNQNRKKLECGNTRQC